MPVTDMADRARISAWRPLMAEGAGPDAWRAARPYGVPERRAAQASLGERPVVAAARGKQGAAQASLGGRPVVVALGEQRAAQASLGERPVVAMWDAVLLTPT
jgi:hypothetical protein